LHEARVHGLSSPLRLTVHFLADICVRDVQSLYAFSVKPFSSVDRSTLPADATACPYTAGSKPPPAAPAAAAAAHPFPSDASSNKRQRVDGGAASGAGPDPRFAPGFMNSMQQYDAASAMSNGAMRWDMSKPQRGPPPHHYICRRCNEPGHWSEPTKAITMTDSFMQRMSHHNHAISL